MPLKFIAFLAILLSFLLSRPGVDPGKGSPADTPSVFNAGIDGFCSEVFSMLKTDLSKPDYKVFREAFTGFLNLKAENQISKNILTIIDFSLSSKLERMWIIDFNTMEIVRRSLVAHGRNSGEEFATSFSNSPSSHKSSLGFYTTGGIYNGNNGVSLLLDGVEPGINDNALQRAIVVHGAGYVSESFIHQFGRLGRSFGCPSIPLEDHEKVISLLSGGSCIYIYYPDKKYLESSKMLSLDSAAEGMYRLMSELNPATLFSNLCLWAPAAVNYRPVLNFQGR